MSDKSFIVINTSNGPSGYGGNLYVMPGEEPHTFATFEAAQEEIIALALEYGHTCFAMYELVRPGMVGDLLKALNGLLGCCELNLDSLEPATAKIVDQALQAINVIAKANGYGKGDALTPEAVLDYAEKETGVKSMVHERWELGGWPGNLAPKTPGDYLAWIEDEIALQAQLGPDRIADHHNHYELYVDELQPYATLLRQLGVEPSKLPWEILSQNEQLTSTVGQLSPTDN